MIKEALHILSSLDPSLAIAIGLCLGLIFVIRELYKALSIRYMEDRANSIRVSELYHESLDDIHTLRSDLKDLSKEMQHLNTDIRVCNTRLAVIVRTLKIWMREYPPTKEDIETLYKEVRKN